MAGTFQLTCVPGYYTLSDSSRGLSNSAFVLTKTTTARFPCSSSSSRDQKLNVRLTCAPNTRRRPFVCRASSGERDTERETSLRERFEKWCQTHDVVYGGKEEWLRRFEIYKSNVQYIDYHNSLNKFADLTEAEFKARYSMNFPYSFQGLVSAASSLADLGALVLSTPDPISKSHISHLAFSRWRSDNNLPVGSISHLPSSPARPPKPLLVPTNEVPSPKDSDLPLNAYMLHNLAHIELNAIDLAWDTVARFSPFFDVLGRDFFDDFAHVADDESRHFMWCSQRLAELGFKLSPLLDDKVSNFASKTTLFLSQSSCLFLSSRYGDIPANNLLMRECQNTSSNVAARLAVIPLVQEARGLDAGPRLVKRLMGFGDHRTSKIVKQIADEEIAHVAVGVHWYLSVCHKMNRAPCPTFKDLIKEYGAELRGPFNHSARETAGIPRDWYDPSCGTGVDEGGNKQGGKEQLSAVYDRLTHIISMESENSSLERPAKCNE